VNAGLPGTGLGGLFYLLLALWMPVPELVRTAQGRSSRERWRLVASQFTLACAIIAVVVATTAAVGAVRPTGAPSILGGHGWWLALAPAVIALTVLLLLVAVLRAWAFLDARRGSSEAGTGPAGRGSEML